ncbi:cysteine proteinase 1 [Thecamonas trahens ATCC 50062]|uniref:Cysteine proteinase 1 n=1 Tax=Thecamonas trahens ATCC 50062 TaxID=461836 RepID=A0A0L0DQF0_THETB|nr:cysteine proteinase 1 [Thecamonas trahens ATCC 50062]KNC54251.1 cysteine proteinase 1 [Thecamonas trahens ATCC 50062]|eukprot:XP_013753886.1 cysteine proteinase 1 [Thecamonas trahens ATCC 50062]
MKITLLALVALAAIASAHSVQLVNEFEAWKAQHGKMYASLDEHNARLSIFADNKLRAAALNARSQTATFGMNAFADLSPEEFKASFLSSSPATLPSDYTLDAPAGNKDIPSSYDWRTHTPPVVNPVKNQGQCGSCWAFSAVSAIESAWALAGNPLVSLSEQNIIDCTLNNEAYCIKYHGQKSCPAGCNGGLQPEAYLYVMANHGIDTESSYPYQAVDGTCEFKSSSVGATVSNWTFVSTYEAPNEEAVAEALVEHGPLAIAADASEWQLYMGGVFDLPCGHSLDHGIVIVGYGSKKTILGKEHPIWIIRNSWGASWGEKGYMYLQRGDNKCGVADYVTRPIIH